MPPLHLLIKPASGLCNMRCSYCFYHDISQKRQQASYGIMNESTQENVLRRAFEFADHQITIAYQGGEPTLAGLAYFARAQELQAKYNVKNIRINNAIQTNGLDIDESWARFFADNNFLVGLSIDGTKDSHDRYRIDHTGKGTFNRIMKTTRLFDKYNVQYNILTVVNSLTARHIQSIYSFFKKNGFKYLQFIPCLDPLGEKPGSSQYSLTNDMFSDFMIRLFDAWYRDVEAGQNISIRTFDNYISMLMGYPPESCNMGGICSAQNVVEADGSVYPCDFYVLDQYNLGNLNYIGFDEISQKATAASFIEESAQFSLECRECEYFFICRGGCKRMRSIPEEGGVPHYYFCEGHKAFFSHSLDRMRSLARRLSMRR
ncbi:MAG: anaerobic sulfatase maturase [Christensenellales bacterium]|jgi:uncharacterized protein